MCTVDDSRRCAVRVLLGRRFVCDELDGRAARAFNQTSTMGAVLDMVTDR
jgi:CDP-diacylglycerol--inositol 3-phosphatidyltransferase